MRSTTIHQRKPSVNVDPLPVGLARYIQRKANRPGSLKPIGRAMDIISILFNACLKACVLEFNAKTTYNGASGLHLRLLSNATGSWDSLRGTIMVSLMQHFLTDSVE